MKNLTVYYRLSDKGNDKRRLDVVNNKNCLDNFLKAFPAEIVEIIADNVSNETLNWLNDYNFKKIHQTSLGNSGSFWYAFNLAVKLPKEDYVYFVENDYIHKVDSMGILLEGLSIADYVTLYDHPDKYIDGINPGVKDGGEKSKVFLTRSTHWKITNSTTMTFAARVASLQQDRFFFKYFTVGILKKGFPILKRFQGGNCPNDYRLFTVMCLVKKRRLISSIPGYSTHGEKDFLAPLNEWEKYIS